MDKIDEKKKKQKTGNQSAKKVEFLSPCANGFIN